MNGFFSDSELEVVNPTPSLIPQCGACQLHKHCHSPWMKWFGLGERKILLLGEAAGSTEDAQGIPFVGKSGQLLARTLTKFGVNMDRDCWRTNSIICRSHTPEGKNRTPTDKEIGYCRPTVINTINELKPEVIIPLGGTAVKSLIGWLWRPEVGLVSRWDGWHIPSQQINAWVCPTWHPAHIMRQDDGASGRQNEVRVMFFERHLEAACKLRGRPWKRVPDWKSQVRVILDPDEAAECITAFYRDSNQPVAIDVETDRLKPDKEDSDIVSCALSNGQNTISYPWHGNAIRATKALLKSDQPKIGFNVKFERRWFLAKLGTMGRNWVWDGMLAAHVLDNRPSISSLEFQSFVLLGVPPWDRHVSKYMRSVDNREGANSKNRIREASLDKLLTYGGYDALLEWKVGMRQAKKMGVEL